MNIEKAVPAINLLEASPAPLTRLIAATPTVSIFGGWGPRMDRSTDILKGR